MPAHNGAQLGIALLVITHDLAVVRYICDRVAVLYRGHVVKHGPAGQVCAHPSDPNARRLLAAAPRFAKEVW